MGFFPPVAGWSSLVERLAPRPPNQSPVDGGVNKRQRRHGDQRRREAEPTAACHGPHHFTPAWAAALGSMAFNAFAHHSRRRASGSFNASVSSGTATLAFGPKDSKAIAALIRSLWSSPRISSTNTGTAAIWTSSSKDAAIT